ncbi:MAG: GH92 family glycosyl hydrolase [Bacteroidales bacterium]|nr:GH92 family glycosyl hydrolase [Candidatus Cryptobacteroides onthequi]
MKRILSSVLLFITACTALAGNVRHLSDWVDTNVGVIDKGASNCVVGPMLPYGSINPSPQTPKGTSDGYKPSQPIRGFGQLHVSGTGWPTYGNFLVSPMTGLQTSLLSHDSAHSGEVTKPYLFSTVLDRYGIRVDVTPSHYSAIYRFTFPESDESSIVFDAVHSIAGDIFPPAQKVVHRSESSIDTATGTVRMMLEMTGGWPELPHTIYFVGKLSRTDFTGAGSWREGETFPGLNEISSRREDAPCDSISGLHIGSYCTFSTRDGESVYLKLATSFAGYDKAEELLDSEIPGWDFDRVMHRARSEWDRKLSTVRVKSENEDDLKVFYSALYRFYTFAHDRSRDRAEGQTSPYWDDNYAYWDTFRTVYPLLLLLDEDTYRSNIEALMDRFEQRGGVWDAFVAGQDRKSDQGGNDVDCIIADGFVKNVKGIDWERAYKILRYNADEMRIGMDQKDDGGAHLKYKELGWIPACTMSSSQTLEFAYNDYCASVVADGLGHKEDAERWLARSAGWINLWNPDLESCGYRGFMDARTEEGEFLNIDPKKFGGSWVSPFYEGKSWTYSYYVPHDMEKVIELMGGPKKFVERLSYGYENRLTEYDNEPGFLTLRAFTDAGRPDLSSYWAHVLMNSKFTVKGYPDNEDTGSMGSWYAFCAMGIFPDAGQDFYYLNAPKFSRIGIRLPHGKKLRIICNASEENVCIDSCSFRGKPVEGCVLKHEDLMRGGTLKMELAPFRGL